EDVDIQKLSSHFVLAPPSPEAKAEPPPKAVITPELSVEQFGQMDLRAGKVLAAERVPKKDKLLKLSIDLGEAAPRTIVSGVAQSYEPQELVGKVVCVVAAEGIEAPDGALRVGAVRELRERWRSGDVQAAEILAPRLGDLLADPEPLVRAAALTGVRLLRKPENLARCESAVLALLSDP